MIANYTDQKKKQQKAVLEKLLLVLDELETDYLYTDNPINLYYGEEDREYLDHKHARKAQELVECIRCLKHLRRSERLIPFIHNQ